MILAVIGSRKGFEYPQIEAELDTTLYFEIEAYKTHSKPVSLPLTILSGGAIGVDTFAKNWVIKRKRYPVAYIEIRPIDKTSKISYLYRNIEIITKADKILAFWNGESKGTKFTIDYAKTRGKEVKVIMVK